MFHIFHRPHRKSYSFRRESVNRHCVPFNIYRNLIGYGITWALLFFYPPLLSFFSIRWLSQSHPTKWNLFWIISTNSWQCMHILGIPIFMLFPFMCPSWQYRSMEKWISCLQLYKFNLKRFAIIKRFYTCCHVLSCVRTDTWHQKFDAKAA